MKQQNIRSGMIIVLLAALLLLPSNVLAVVGDIELVGVPPGEVITLIDETGKRTDAKTEVRKDTTGSSIVYIPAQNLREGKYTIGWREVTAKNVPLGTGLNRIDLAKLTEPVPGWSASGQISFERRETGQTGSGVVIPGGVTPGEEPFLVRSPKWISGASPAVRVVGPVMGREVQLGVKAFFGSGRNSDSEPIAGESVGITFDEQVDGSTGLNLGATGGRGSAKVDAASVEVVIALADLFYQTEKNGFEFKTGPRLVVGHDRTDYEGRFQSETFSGISSTRDREVRQTYVGPGVTVQKTLRLTDNVELYAGVNVDALYSHGRYKGRQRALCDLCAPALQDVAIRTSDRDSRWIFRPAVSAGAEYEFNSSSIGVTAGYEYWSNLLVLRDRANPLKPRPGLAGESAHRFWLGIFFQYKFDQH